MGQYRQGTVSVTEGSQTVLGEGTSWLANVQPGNLFSISNDNVWYSIAAVVGDGELTLATPYSGDTEEDLSYAVHRDFTPNLSMPYPTYGDTGTGSLLGVAMTTLDAAINTLSAGSVFGGTISNQFVVQKGYAGAPTKAAGLVVKRGTLIDASILFRDDQAKRRWEFNGFDVGQIGQLHTTGNVGLGEEPGVERLRVAGDARIAGNIVTTGTITGTLAGKNQANGYAGLNANGRVTAPLEGLVYNVASVSAVTDLDNLTAAGEYNIDVPGKANVPPAFTSGWIFLRVQTHTYGTGSYCRQYAMDMDTIDMNIWSRQRAGGAWSGWTRIAGTVGSAAGNLVALNGSAKIDAGLLDLQRVINTQTVATYTFQASDVTKYVRMTFSGAKTATVPLNSSQAIAVGGQISVIALNGDITLSPAAGVTLNGASAVVASGTGATLIKVGTNEWDVIKAVA